MNNFYRFFCCSPLSKVASTKGTWGDSAPPPTAVTSELWGAPMAKSRGPPPGLAKGGSNIGIATNGWSNAGNSRASWSSQSGTWGSPWLFLRNLTAQVVNIEKGRNWDGWFIYSFVTDRRINFAYFMHATRAVAELPPVPASRICSSQVFVTRRGYKGMQKNCDFENYLDAF